MAAKRNENRLHKGINFFREMKLLESYFCMAQYLEDGRINFLICDSLKKFTTTMFTSLCIGNKQRLETGTRTDSSYLYVEFKSPTLAKFRAF